MLSLCFGKRSSALDPHSSFTPSASMTDVGAFSIIVIRLLWRRPPSVRMSSVVQTVIKDATIYVLLLCTSRIIFVFLLVFPKVHPRL